MAPFRLLGSRNVTKSVIVLPIKSSYFQKLLQILSLSIVSNSFENWLCDPLSFFLWDLGNWSRATQNQADVDVWSHMGIDDSCWEERSTEGLISCLFTLHDMLSLSLSLANDKGDRAARGVWLFSVYPAGEQHLQKHIQIVNMLYP